ncbi:hypothetical protein [Nocardioides sp. zg-1230]|uniref:hypothetical protein n=1 Tax=Nocardioides sp. zg-1230 TaxID=2736601 RepID=UPI0015574B36|nr:hypothetical protein [Nocardioides sp. zg-1230]NPC41228.1 hypothetical protein [Nocardioides sp. zg-1230]
MTINGFTAAYVAPDRLAISGTIVAGSAANEGTLTFTTEPHLFGRIDVVAGATGVVVPNANGSFSITYPATPGSFTTTLDLGEDHLAGLFKGYRGEQTFLTADVEPSVSDPETVPVAQLPRSTVETVQGDAVWISYTAVRVTASGLRLTAEPQPSVGRLRLAMTVPSKVYNNPNPPTVSNLAPGWMVDPLNTVRHWGGGWTLRFVTTQEAHTSLTGDAAHRGIGAFSVDLDQDSTAFFDEGQRVLVDVTTDETAFGWGEDDFKVNVQQPYVVLGARPAPPAG